MMRSWSRLATRSRAWVIASTISSWAGSRPPSLAGSNRVSNSDTSIDAMVTFAARAASTYSWLKVEPVWRRYLATARRMTT